MRLSWKTWGAASLAVLALSLAAAPAMAADDEDRAVVFSGEIDLDVQGAISGGLSSGVHVVDTEFLTAEVDFEKLSGWTGGSASATLLHTSKEAPNDDVGALEGVNNNEVGSDSTRLFEAWVQQAFGDKGSVRVGLQDLNGEFYATDSSGLLLAPQSGLASELAATGPGGPSTYPQAGLAVRLSLTPSENTYLQAAAYNAHVGSIGDAGGVDTSFNEGVIEIVEGGWTGAGKLALGAWRYSHKQDDLFDTDLLGHPIKRTSQGYYLLAEHMLLDGGDDGRSITGFFRAGVSDGDTGPFGSSWQTGLLVEHAVMSRPDSQLSIGFNQAHISDKYRAASAAGGAPIGSTEGHFELTYYDKITDHFSIQPDLQVVINPGGDKSAKNAVVGMVRFVAGF